MIQTVHYKTRDEWLELKKNDITSTEISALYDFHPHLSYYETWITKKLGLVLHLDQTTRMKWGNRLETVIAEGIAEDGGLLIVPKKYYAHDPDLRIGSSFDFEILKHPKRSGRGNLECKNVDSLVYKNNWSEFEAPPHIELQCQHQLLFGGEYAVAGVLVGGNDTIKYEWEADKTIHADILDKVAKFWKSIDENNCPEPKFPTDADFIIGMNKISRPGSIYEGYENLSLHELAEEYYEASQKIKGYEADKKTAKAKILMLIGDHEKALGKHFTVSSKVIAATMVDAYEKKSYRDFRINFKKGFHDE